MIGISKNWAQAGLVRLGAAVVSAVLVIPGLAVACPTIDGLVDYNCDGQVKILFTGDSIVRGVGDTSGSGGYVGRLQEEFPAASVNNLGIPGTTSKRLLTAFKKNLNKKKLGPTKLLVNGSDYVFIAVGVNDYWLRKSPGSTVTNIRRLVKLLREYVEAETGVAALVAVSTITPNAREFQQPFVKSLNRSLLKRKSASFPVGPRLDTFSTSILSTDGLHPDTEGYKEIELYLADFIRDELMTQAKSRRPDGDKDGVYDLFEETRYFTSTLYDDTDGDSWSDGYEIFTSMTNPLMQDTDGDLVIDSLDETPRG